MQEGKAFHFTADAVGLVGEADETERTLQVPVHHAVETVDIFRPVFDAPFHAQDVALSGIRGGRGRGGRGNGGRRRHGSV